ncbi:MAG TPA: phage tail tape measure protein [Bacteroidales bacterium]|nr:phage tail tape measure protein [Bacteroidales bacterium]HSA43598.1 phage tail tape measure protein [Bacteroidales bacterium]
MADKTTNWILKLTDLVTGPMKKITTVSGSAVLKVKELTDQYDRLEKKSSALTSSFVKIAAGAAAFGVLASGSLAFESAMARANTMSGQGAEQFKGLTDQVKKIASVVPIAKKELADGLYEVFSNGVPEKNWVSFLESSSRTAVGSVADLKQVVGVTATVIKNYKLSWDDTLLVQDKIQRAAQLGKTQFQELGEYLPLVAGSASQLGISIDELLGSFATLTGVSGNTATVSTQLNAVMTALIKPTSEATEVAKKMGFQFDAAAVKASGGLIPFLNNLKPSVESFARSNGMLAENIYATLFGSAEAMKGLLPVIGSVKDDFIRKTSEIAQSSGTISQAFGIMSQTTESKAQAFKNNLSNAMDGVVSILKPAADSFLGLASRVMESVGSFMKAHPFLARFLVIGGSIITVLSLLGIGFTITAIKLQMLHTKLLMTAASGTGFSGAMARALVLTGNFAKQALIAGFNLLKLSGRFILTAIQGVGAFIISLISATAAQWGLNIAMNANPIGLIVLGILAIGAAVYGLIKYWDQVKAFLAKMGKWMWEHNPFRFVIDLIDRVFPGFKEKVKEIFQSVINWFKKMWDKIKGVWNSITSFLGFGSTEVEVKVDDSDVEKAAAEKPAKKPTDYVKESATPTKTGDSVTADVSGSAASVSGTKSIVMNLTVNMYNTFASGVKDKAEKVKQELASLIVDAASDAAVTIS